MQKQVGRDPCGASLLIVRGAQLHQIKADHPWITADLTDHVGGFSNAQPGGVEGAYARSVRSVDRVEIKAHRQSRRSVKRATGAGELNVRPGAAFVSAAFIRAEFKGAPAMLSKVSNMLGRVRERVEPNTRQRVHAAVLDQTAEGHAAADGITDVEVRIKVEHARSRASRGLAMNCLQPHQDSSDEGERQVMPATDGHRKKPHADQRGRGFAYSAVRFVQRRLRMSVGGLNIARVEDSREADCVRFGNAVLCERRSKRGRSVSGAWATVIQPDPGVIGNPQEPHPAAHGKPMQPRGQPVGSDVRNRSRMGKGHHTESLPWPLERRSEQAGPNRMKADFIPLFGTDKATYPGCPPRPRSRAASVRWGS